MLAKKKRIAVALCLVVCMVLFPAPKAMAAVVDKGSEIVPMMEYIYDAECDFTITNGVAYMYASVTGDVTAATKCEVEVELQEKGLLFWNSVKTWTCTENGQSAEIDVSHRVTSGEKYRMVATFTVWSGTESETQTMTSKTVEA